MNMQRWYLQHQGFFIFREKNQMFNYHLDFDVNLFLSRLFGVDSFEALGNQSLVRAISEGFPNQVICNEKKKNIGKEKNKPKLFSVRLR